jgi:topoisomerase-4 subunit B
MPGLIADNKLFLAMPPLYRLTQGGKTIYARDDADRERLMKTAFRAGAKVEVSRFKGLGEMMPAQLKETTMRPGARSLIQVDIAADKDETESLVERLMGKKPELRFRFIQENAAFAREAVDV